MKIISYLSKIAFICNICFVLFLIFGSLEAEGTVPDFNQNAVISFLKTTVITLGFLAFLINFIMVVIYLVLLLRKKLRALSWLPVINTLFLLFQLYFYLIR